MESNRAWKRLRDRGLRMTPLKKEVVGLFLGGACGLSAREIMGRLRTEVHISSVHRCLASLERAGFLRPDRNDDGVHRYRCSRQFYPDHGHFRCAGCGRRFPVHYRLPEAFLSEIESSGGFRIYGSDLMFEGKCDECSGSEN